MRLLGGLVLVLNNCATMGACQLPPSKHEDYTLVACETDSHDWRNVVCVYAKPDAAIYGVEEQMVRVASKQCGPWRITYKGAL